MTNDYNALLAKYNRLVSRFNDLQTQSIEKQKTWKKSESVYKKNEMVARSLCEQILAKDKNEMVLGTEYSWSQLDTNTLLEKAKTSFADYNMRRTKLLKQIQDAAEERRLQIESLSLQLTQNLHDRNAGQQNYVESDMMYDSDTGEVLDSTDKPENQSDASSDSQNILSTSSQETQKVIKKTSYNMQKAVKSGKINVVIEEEDSDVSLADVQQQSDMAHLKHCVTVEKEGIKVMPSAKKNAAVERERKKQSEIMMMDIEPIRERLTDRHWLFIEIIGKYGYCEVSDMHPIYDKLYLERKMGKRPLAEGAFRYTLTALSDYNIVLTDNNVHHPVKSKFYVYSLSDIGKRFYEQQFGEKPVVSERDVLIAEHDNLEHAFGIKTLKEILETSGEYTSVSMSRANNTIKITENAQYIPDIIAVGKMKGKPRGFTAYMEYERNTHHQAHFNEKLNKMLSVTKWLNIVTPNISIARQLTEKVNAWIESRGIQSIRSAKVRVTTIKRLMDAVPNGYSINDDKNWYAVYTLANGPEPIIREK